MQKLSNIKKKSKDGSQQLVTEAGETEEKTMIKWNKNNNMNISSDKGNCLREDMDIAKEKPQETI